VTMDISAILNRIRPGEAWSLDGDTYDGLTWLDSTAKPTLQELEASWADTQAERLNEQARAARLSAFRDEADPLFFGWQRGENTEQEWLDKCEEIRQRFPYVPVPSVI